jgi:hypothetical protein
MTWKDIFEEIPVRTHIISKSPVCVTMKVQSTGRMDPVTGSLL